MNKRPILHVSICYENCSSAIKKELKKQLATYSQLQDHCIPYADICLRYPTNQPYSSTILRR